MIRNHEGLPVGFPAGLARRQRPRAAGPVLAPPLDDDLRSVAGHGHQGSEILQPSASGPPSNGRHWSVPVPACVRHDGQSLAKARASGRKLGRPKGSLGVSRLDGKENEIRHFLELGVSKTAIAKITGVSRTALYSFMSTRACSGRSR